MGKNELLFIIGDTDGEKKVAYVFKEVGGRMTDWFVITGAGV